MKHSGNTTSSNVKKAQKAVERVRSASPPCYQDIEVLVIVDAEGRFSAFGARDDAKKPIDRQMIRDVAHCQSEELGDHRGLFWVKARVPWPPCEREIETQDIVKAES